ncbi:hypothetical protein ABS71_13990, partial [bacterium SCN 62-11]
MLELVKNLLNSPQSAQSLDLDWNPSQALSLGVECEVQLVDWKTQDLCPAAGRVLPLCHSGQVKSEIYQSMVELCTGVCPDLTQVEADLRRARNDLLQTCQPLGIEVLGAGTHPFAPRQQRMLSNASPRYGMLLERNQWIARRMSIYGLHVHVGVPGPDQAVLLMNGLLPYLAGLLALSASSPFWHGEDTGLASARSTVFESHPSGGTPPVFRDWAHFRERCALMLRSHSIVSLKDLWWDIRPNPVYGTVEIRICDGTPGLSDTLALVALIQCLSARILHNIELGHVPDPTSDWILRENKWRALRWGLEANLIEDEEGNVSPVQVQLTRWLEELSPYAERLNCLNYLEKVRARLHMGSSVLKQRQIYQQTGSLRCLVQSL